MFTYKGGGEVSEVKDVYARKKKCLLFLNSDKHLGKICIYKYTRKDPNLCFTLGFVAFACKA